MNARFLSQLRGGAALAASVAVLLTGCAAGTPSGGSGRALDSDASGPASVDADAVRVVLRFGDELATAKLDNSSAAREFAAMLPMQLDLRDPMGQAKSGPLPGPIDVTGAQRILDPSAGEFYYWPPSGDIGIFYDDLGQSVPPPGMVRLGVVDSGLDAIASAGNRPILRIYPMAPTNS